MKPDSDTSNFIKQLHVNIKYRNDPTVAPVYTTTIINYFLQWLWNKHVRCISAHIFKIMEIEKFNIYNYIYKLCQKKVRPFLIRFNSLRCLLEGNQTTISTFSSTIINDFEKQYPTRFLFTLLPSLKVH